MSFEDNPADERRILDEIDDQFKWVMANNVNAKDAWMRARQHVQAAGVSEGHELYSAAGDVYVFMAVIARLDSVIRDLKDQLGEALERALPPGHFIAKDNSDPQQVWLWAGERDESAEPVCRLPIEVE